MTNYAGPGPVDTQQALVGHHESHERGGGDEVRPWHVGDVVMAYGVLATLLNDRPGWKAMDGTVTLLDGTTPPDMRDRFPVGAGTTYALGATGGSAVQASHPNLAHTNNHSTSTDTLVSGTNLANAFPAGAISTTTGGHTHTAHGDHAISTHGTNLPPYAALYFLIYVGGQ